MSTQKSSDVGCPREGWHTTDDGERRFNRSVSRILCIIEMHEEDCRSCPNGTGTLTFREATRTVPCPVIEAAHREARPHSTDPCAPVDMKNALSWPHEPVDLNTCLFTRPFFYCPSCKGEPWTRKHSTN